MLTMSLFDWVNECKVSFIHKKKKKKHSPLCIHIDTLLEAILASGSAVKLKENEYQYRTQVNTSHAKASHTGDQWTELKKKKKTSYN